MPTQALCLSLDMACAYLIENEAGVILVDTGLAHNEQRILQTLHDIGWQRLQLIYITHAHTDHYGSAAELKRLTGAPVAIHRDDATAMARGQSLIRSVRGAGIERLQQVAALREPPEPIEADLLLDDGASLSRYGLDVFVLHTPGHHTPGSSCLLVEKRLVCVGDLITNNAGTQMQQNSADDWSLIPTSVIRLQQYKPEWVYAGHGCQPISGETLQGLKTSY